MTRSALRWYSSILVLTWLALPGIASASWQEDELLEPDAAFVFSADAENPEHVRLHWQIADGYYLYRSRFQFRSDTPGIEIGEPRFPAGKVKDDEFFGKVEVYRGPLDIQVPITRSANAPATFKLIAVSQGCADQGVCYPPHTQTAELSLPAAAGAAVSTATNGALDKLTELSRELGFDNNDNEFLDPDIAFRPTITAADDGSSLVARWDIEDGYYLYRDKFQIKLETGEGISLQEAQFPAGKIKEDETFGRVEVYYHSVETRIPLTRSRTEASTIRVKLGYQGCAEAGICYPPQTKVMDVDLPAGAGAAAPTATQASTASAAPQNLADSAPLTEQDRIARILTEKPLWLSMLLFFVLGIGLSVTPCVFPMIPILSSIIVGQGEGLTTRRAFTLSLVYVLAMALTYTVAGVVAALFGENLQAAFQNPWILSSFAAVFVLLALSMFGFYDLQMPAVLQSRLSTLSNRQQGGTLVGVAVMGFLSALIVGPCVAAPLAAALLVIGQTGDTLLGGSALFALSMGMGLPLLAFGTGAGKLLPRAGGWMNAVKAVFGVLLLAVAIWMLERIVPAAASMTMWAILLITSAVYMGALEKLALDATGWHKLWKGVGLILLVYGVLVLTGVAAGGKDVLQPLRGITLAGNPASTLANASVDFQRVKSSADLDQAIAQANQRGKTVMLDFYADWCTECHRMEKNSFQDPNVLSALGNTVALQADVTANDDTDKALLQRFKLIGPPAILFFDRSGQELARHRVVGYMGPEPFAAHVQRAYGGN